MKTTVKASVAALVAAAALTAPTVGVLAQAEVTLDPGIVSSSEATAFVPVTSYRVFDSRDGDKMTVLPDDVLPADRVAIFALADTDFNPQIPAEARAVAYNITITQTEGSGFIDVHGWANFGGATTSVIAWDEGAGRLSNSGTSLLTTSFDDPGHLGITIGGENAAAHVLIDITGYYVALDDVDFGD